jgi:hypothetical protein
MDFEDLHLVYKEPTLHGRYVTLKHIEPLIKKIAAVGEIATVGQSVQRQPLYVCKIGRGEIKVLMWSQMHGNESTTTKAVFDLFRLLSSNDDFARLLREKFTFHIVPMLNPDGAQLYTRENANGIDLNRDFCDLSQPESIALFDYFKKIMPDYCFNLHDQRTIYGAGESGKPATISFLAPSHNESRDINASRQKAMEIIVSMNHTLQQYIPGQVGRFDDSFNINCVGDTFQFHEVPTILFEAGHCPGDYKREETRKFIFIALLSALQHIRENVVVNNGINEYLNIPQNKINFLDFVYKNVKINCDGIEKITNFGAQFSEVLNGGEIQFEAQIAEVEISDEMFGHTVFDGRGESYNDGRGNKPGLDQKADFFIGIREFVNGQEMNSGSGKP